MSARQALKDIVESVRQKKRETKKGNQCGKGILRIIDEVPDDGSIVGNTGANLADDLMLRMMRAQDSVRTLPEFDLDPFNGSQASNNGFESDTDKAYSDSSEPDSSFYVAEANDSIDLAMADFLTTDDYGKTVTLPVIRIDRGLYMIGLLKYSLRKSEDDELIGANTGLLLKDMIEKIHEK